MRFTTNLMLCGLALSGLVVSQVVDGQSTPPSAAKASTMTKPMTVTAQPRSASWPTQASTSKIT